MAPENFFPATGYDIVSCWLHYWKDCKVCGISRKELEFRASVIAFFASKKKGRKKIGGPGLYLIDVETEV
jgi:hypothetical protein